MFCEKCGLYCEDNADMLCDSCYEEERSQSLNCFSYFVAKDREELCRD